MNDNEPHQVADGEDTLGDEEEGGGEEESSLLSDDDGKPVTVEARQRRTIKRLEEDLNALKRKRREDHTVICNLHKVVSEALKDKESRQREEGSIHRVAEVMANQHASMTETAACLSQALVKERFDHLNALQRLDSTEDRLKRLHRRLFPVCCVCQDVSGQIQLHGEGEKSKADHVVCLSCLKGMVRVTRNDKSSSLCIECPLCKEKVSNIPSLSIQGLADADTKAWLVGPDSVLSPMYTSMAREIKKEAVNTVLYLLGIANSSFREDRSLQKIEDALQVVSGNYEDGLVLNDRPVVEIVDD